MPEHPRLTGEAGAPPVVAVVVAFDPGPWLEDCLTSLQDQGYPNCAILVIDNASAAPLAPRVAAVAPAAYLHRAGENRGFGPAANSVLELVENAAFYLFCHDDVVLSPDALQKMVEEAFRSNAGIVSPKLLDAEEPVRLLQLGLGLDRLGAPVRRVERGEIDQAQHDEVREVFAAPGACTLVRADLFSVIGGFDPEIALFGEDVDLCWRARLAGARVVVEPAAEVGHLELTASRRRPFPDTRAYRFRHELRAVLKNYGPARRVVALSQLAVVTAVEMAYFLLLGNSQRARELLSCWRWNLAPERHLNAARAAVASYRRVPDRIVVALFASRRSHLWRILRRYLPERFLGDSWAKSPVPEARAGDDLAPAPRGRRASWARAAALASGERTAQAHHEHERRAHHERRPAFVPVVAVLVGLVLVLGSRAILFGPTPLVGELLAIPPPGDLLGHFFGGFVDAGLQRPGPATPAFVVLGLAGGILFGATGLLLVVELALCLVLGAFGVARLLRPLGPPSARLAGSIAYLFVPLAWNDLARGEVQALVAYAALPWLLGRLARSSRLPPFDEGADSKEPWWREVLGLSLLLAFVGAFDLLLLPVALLVGVGLGLGGALVGGPRPAWRPLVNAAAGAAGGFVLLLPWSLTYLQPGARWSVLLGSATALSRAPELSDLLRFAVGPMGHGLLGWALFGAASVVLLVGRGARLAWASRFWICGLLLFGVTWAAEQGWLGSGGGALGVLLAPAACCLACCVGLGAAAVALDLPRARFGWRHLASLAGGCCAAAFLLPVLGAAPGGRWGQPASGYDTVLSWTAHLHQAGADPSGARVLWLGDPAALPLPSWQVRPGLGVAVSSGGLPDATRLWPSADPGLGNQLITDVTAAEAGDSVQLGHLLASAQVAEVVVPSATAPVLGSLQRPPSAPPPASLITALDEQTDLHELPSEGGARVFENTAWRPSVRPAPQLTGAGGTPAPLRSLAIALEVALWVAAGWLLTSRRFRRRAILPARAPTSPELSGEPELRAAAGVSS